MRVACQNEFQTSPSHPARDLEAPGQTGAAGVPSQLSAAHLQGFFFCDDILKVFGVHRPRQHESFCQYPFRSLVVCRGLGTGLPLPPVNQFFID